MSQRAGSYHFNEEKKNRQWIKKKGRLWEREGRRRGRNEETWHKKEHSFIIYVSVLNQHHDQIPVLPTRTKWAQTHTHTFIPRSWINETHELKSFLRQKLLVWANENRKMEREAREWREREREEHRRRTLRKINSNTQMFATLSTCSRLCTLSLFSFSSMIFNFESSTQLDHFVFFFHLDFDVNSFH